MRDELLRTFRHEEFRDGWRLLVACVIGVAFGMSAMGLTYTLGAFVQPLSAEFDATRKQVLNVSIYATLAVIPASLVAGAFVDRFGARRLALASTIGFGVVFIALGVVTSSLQSLYLLYFLLPLLGIGTTPITYARAIARRFDRHRGFALGIALGGTGICALLVPPYLAWIIEQWGWRAGYVALGVLPLAVSLPIAWAWLHDSATPAASAAQPAPRATASAPALPGLYAREAFTSWRFWTMALAFLVVSGAATGLLTNVVPLLASRGYPPMTAASALSVFGVAVVLGRLAVGLLVDRYWAPFIGACFLVPAALSLATLVPTDVSWTWTLVALVIVGLATGAELDLCAYLTARYFGLRAYGRVYGALFVAFAAGAGAVGPVFGGLYDRFDSYAPVLLVAGGGYLACALLLLALGRYPEFASARG